MTFSMHCRRGKTEAVFAIPDFARYPPGSSFDMEYLVVSQEAIRTHSVDRRWVRQRGVEQRWNELSGSIDASFTGDVGRFLKSLPDDGVLSVRVRDKKASPMMPSFILRAWNLCGGTRGGLQMAYFVILKVVQIGGAVQPRRYFRAWPHDRDIR